MPANGRRDLIRRLKVKYIPTFTYSAFLYFFLTVPFNFLAFSNLCVISNVPFEPCVIQDNQYFYVTITEFIPETSTCLRCHNNISRLGANGYLNVNNYLNPRKMQKQEMDVIDFKGARRPKEPVVFGRVPSSTKELTVDASRNLQTNDRSRARTCSKTV